MEVEEDVADFVEVNDRVVFFQPHTCDPSPTITVVYQSWRA